MCSIGEGDDFGDDGGVHAMVPDTVGATPQPDRGDCKKCGKSDIEVYKLSFREAECRDCFLLYVRHKFRACLGSSKILPRDARVLLIFDGRPESVVLLDMLYHAQTQNTFKRLHCTAKILYIDDSAVQETSDAGRRAKLESISEFLQRYELFESYVIAISDTQGTKPSSLADVKSYLDRPCDRYKDFRNNLEKIASLTSRQDFLKHHRSRLMASAAKHFDYQFVFQADTSVSLATQLMTAITLGRGGSAALDVSLVDDRLAEDIKLVRPLKDLNRAEIDLYLRAEKLDPPIKEKPYGTELGNTASLQNLTQAFMDNLQQNFSSTVSTVFRTGDKIAANRDGGLSKNEMHAGSPEKAATCDYCHSPLDDQQSTTLLALEISRMMSEAGAATAGEGEKLRDAAQSKMEATQRYCHGCRNIFTNPDEDLKAFINS